MRKLRLVLLVRTVLSCAFLCSYAFTQAFTPNALRDPEQLTPPASKPQTFDDVIGRVAEREHFLMTQMRHFHPLIETYIQNLKKDQEVGLAPASDQYFFGRLDLSNGTEDHSFLGQPGFGRRMLDKLTNVYAMKFLPMGFAQMVMLDSDFQPKYYNFTFVRREFLGEVRCLVVDAQPSKKAAAGRFVGRISIEDQDYNVVRFNGTYSPGVNDSRYLHFDSWRLNLRPGLWLPAYIYSEESNLDSRTERRLHFKAQTRLWGYDLQPLKQNEEFSKVLVDAQDGVRDQSDTTENMTPVESQRLWSRQAEDNVIDRLHKIGLIAPPGDVDKVLETVINNLVLPNKLNIQPEVRARVLLTTPLEAFTVGHTVVLSRGLLDVLPDEASLAAVLAQQLSHIVLGHHFDTRLAFNDRMFFPDEDAYENFTFARNPSDEEEADRQSTKLLTKSPYKEKLGAAGLFFSALQAREPELKNLIRPHLGNRLTHGKSARMSALLNSGPQLQAWRIDQIAALPLGGRIKLDPWSDRIELLKLKAVELTLAQEKMPFEVTPFFPYLTRFPSKDSSLWKTASMPNDHPDSPKAGTSRE